MRNANQKSRCVKKALPKFTTICKTYDVVQTAYADVLSEDSTVNSIQCNVLLDDDFEGKFTTDFLITRGDGTLAVRECVLRTSLLRPRTIKLLDLSQRYWLKNGVTDWAVIIDAEKK